MLSGLDDAVRIQAFRRMVFNWMAANCDDHTKNHSFLMDERGTWSLSPAYDLTHAFNPRGEWTYQHLMSVNGKFADLTRADLTEFAERHRVLGAGALIDEVAAAIETWPAFAAAAGLSPAAASGIQQEFPLDALTRR